MKKKTKKNKYDEMSLDAILNAYYTNNGVSTSNDAYYMMDRAEHERAIEAFIESLEQHNK